MPATWPQLPTALASPLRSQIGTNAVLTPAQVAALSPAEQQVLNSSRTNTALLQVATQDAYATTSSRFASVQQLINAIPSATDQKGILELQARIQAEQGMLQNDSTKLNVLYQAAQAQEWANRQARTRAGGRERRESAHAAGATDALRVYVHANSARCTVRAVPFRDHCHVLKRRRLCTGAGSSLAYRGGIQEQRGTEAGDARALRQRSRVASVLARLCERAGGRRRASTSGILRNLPPLRLPDSKTK